MRYIDVWDSEQNYSRAFADRIHKAVDSAFGGARPRTGTKVWVLNVLEITGSVNS
ncbi:hypothetical protein [Cryobacterium algoritolerans]|uniref:hypothetical protein n=1 Tax=Cryobacterium algoritolerans TaxID=1259184 RepID=UPI00141B17B7|nr:hypothetical protein [Cryobacterium algoritolerans]